MNRKKDRKSSKIRQVRRNEDDDDPDHESLVETQIRKRDGGDLEPRTTSDNYMFGTLRGVHDDESDDDDNYMTLISTKQQREKRIRPRYSLENKGN